MGGDSPMYRPRQLVDLATPITDTALMVHGFEALRCAATCRIRTDNWNPDAHPPIIGRMGQTLPYEFGNVQYAV
jgi:hypothetical protein